MGHVVTQLEGGARDTAEAVARRSYGKLVAFLAARTRNVAAAEDALSEAFAAALADWPRSGVPGNPEGWLMTVAHRRLIDTSRRRKAGDMAEPHLQMMADELGAIEGGDIPDKRLALMFACAHPAIEESMRAPLILQTVLGLSAGTIASAFLTSPAAMAKRLVRAKDKMRQAGIPFEIPAREDLPGRMSTVLDAIYAAFTEGWTDPAGTDIVRRDLAVEALFLARLVTELMPDEAEALGLAALVFHAEARRAARRTPDGVYVPLAEQDVSLWNLGLIAEADALLRAAIGSRGTTPDGTKQLDRDCRAVRRAAGDCGVACGGDQPRAGDRGSGWPSSSAKSDSGSGCAACELPALLGRAGGLARPLRCRARSGGSVRHGDRPRARPGGAEVSAGAKGGAGELIRLGQAI
jgi:predicted RNA polymerase sigma factor